MEQENKYEKTRCNLYLPKGLIEEVEELAKTYGANRSTMVSFILKTYLDQQKMVKLVDMVPKE